MSKITSALAITILAVSALVGCKAEEVDPITRAAIFGCIEIAEAGSYSDSIRATALENAGCGRYSSQQINSVLPEYREEHARRVSEAKARDVALESRRPRFVRDWFTEEHNQRLAKCGEETFKFAEQKATIGSGDNMRMFLDMYRREAEKACVGFSTEEISEASAKARAAFEAEEAIRAETRRRIEAVAGDG